MNRSRISRRRFVVAGSALLAGPWLGRPLNAALQGWVQGHCSNTFEALRAEFESGFVKGEEVGAAVSVMFDGQRVVDLWGGWVDAERSAEWQADTLVCTMSVSKGIVATCAHMLVDRGLIELDEAVARYWPEFAQVGKAGITVKQLLSHLAALPVADAAQPGDALSWEPLIRALEVQAPIWEPGTKGTYHATTYGHLVGELVQRVSGQRLDEFVDNELAGPLGAEFIFRCNDAEQARVAQSISNPDNELTARGPRTDELSQRIYRLLGDRSVLMTRDFCRYPFPSASGVSNARSLATIFGALARGGRLNGYRVMRPETIERATAQQWAYPDPIHYDDFRVAMGYLLSTDFTYFGPGARTFGTAGSGGYTAFADPDRKLSFAYTPNRFTSGAGNGERTRALIDVLYRGLG